MFDTGEALSENIRQLFIGGHMVNGNEPLLQFITHKMTINFNVLSSLIEDMIVIYVYSSLTVTVHNNWRRMRYG